MFLNADITTISMSVDGRTIKVFGELMNTNPLEQFPVLFSQGYVGMSVSAIMQQRLNLVDASKESRWPWWNCRSYLTGDGIAKHPDGRTKLVLDIPWYAFLNSQSIIENGGLVLEDNQYNGVPGPEFQVVQVRRYGGDMRKEADFTPAGIKANPLWQFFARRQNKLDHYACFAQEFADEHFTQSNVPIMDLNINYDPPERPTIWPVVFYGLHIDYAALGYMSKFSGLEAASLTARCNLPIGIKPKEHRLLIEDDPLFGYLRLSAA